MNKAHPLQLDPADFYADGDGFRLTELGFARVARQKRTDLRRYALGMVGDHWADDIVQNAFVKLLNQVFKAPSAGVVLVWIFKVAHNEAFDILRKQSRMASQEHIEDKPVMPEAERWETRQRIESIMAHLAPVEKACFQLIHQGYSYKEVGEELSMTEDNVAVVVCRARKKLQAKLN